MMTQPIFDMHAVAAEEFVTEDRSEGLLDKLMNNLGEVTQPSEAEVAEEVIDRAVSYDETQPSFAADLREAVMSSGLVEAAPPVDAELADELLDRAVAYDESQPSYAADLRAAVVPAAEQAVAA